MLFFKYFIWVDYLCGGSQSRGPVPSTGHKISLCGTIMSNDVGEMEKVC